MNQTFLAIAKDPAIIPGVHHHCDEWCDYCPLTSRCLTFRCTREFRRERQRRPGAPTFESFDEAIGFTRDIAAVEGMTTDALDALLSHPPGQSEIRTDDPLAASAFAYAIRVELFFGAELFRIVKIPPTRCGPTPEETIVYYHLRIYMRVFRALVARDRRRAGRPTPADEELGSAKLALTMIERSGGALDLLREGADPATIDAFLSALSDLECGLEERFPQARWFVRMGLDHPVA